MQCIAADQLHFDGSLSLIRGDDIECLSMLTIRAGDIEFRECWIFNKLFISFGGL
jgi:hypothetical protein